MTFLIRPANMNDLQPIYEMAKRTGGGFTNLPPDKELYRKSWNGPPPVLTVRMMQSPMTYIYLFCKTAKPAKFAARARFLVKSGRDGHSTATALARLRSIVWSSNAPSARTY